MLSCMRSSSTLLDNFAEPAPTERRPLTRAFVASRCAVERSMRSIWFLCLLFCACGSSSSDSGPGSSNVGGAGNQTTACPDVSGTWRITEHCDPSLVGLDAIVTQTQCSLTFASPFDGFSGSIGADGSLAIHGPQTCTGTASDDTLALSCTPGTCVVTMTR